MTGVEWRLRCRVIPTKERPMASCSDCGRGNWKLGADFFANMYKCQNRACGMHWCSKCVKGMIWKDCPRCGSRCK